MLIKGGIPVRGTQAAARAGQGLAGPGLQRRRPHAGPARLARCTRRRATPATRSVHTDVNLVYDAPTNLFLPGTHVDLQQKATQCLTEFSLDFERTNTVTSSGASRART